MSGMARKIVWPPTCSKKMPAQSVTVPSSASEKIYVGFIIIAADDSARTKPLAVALDRAGAGAEQTRRDEDAVKAAFGLVSLYMPESRAALPRDRAAGSGDRFRLIGRQGGVPGHVRKLAHAAAA